MALATYTTIAPSAIQANAPLTTDLATDWTDNIEHVRQTVYDPDLHTPIIGHDHDGINSKLIAVPVSVAVVVTQWDGDGSASPRITVHTPIQKKVGITFANPATSEDSGYIHIVSDDGTDDGFMYQFANSTRIQVLDASGTITDNPNAMALLSSSPLNLSSQFYTTYLLDEVVGILAIGTYSGTGANQSIDISDTSHSGQPDFQPDLVIVWRTDAGENARIRSTDHAANTSSDHEDGALVTDGIVSFDINGFNLGAGVGNTSGGDYKYMAFKIGAGNGMFVERLVSPNDGIAQDLLYTNSTDTPFLAIAFETTGATPIEGVHIKHLFVQEDAGAGDSGASIKIDTGVEIVSATGIRTLEKDRIALSTGVPNSTNANHADSNIWIIGASPLPIYRHGAR